MSYGLTGQCPISAETRRRVTDASEQLTFEPKAGARALASRRTHVIGLVIPFPAGSDTSGSPPFIETIAGSGRARDHEVLPVTADEGSAGLRRLAGRSLCDAILLMDIEAQDASRIRRRRSSATLTSCAGSWRPPRDSSRRAIETVFQLLERADAGSPPAIDLIRPRLTRRSTVMQAPSTAASIA